MCDCESRATDLVADAMPATWLSEYDRERLLDPDDESDFYLSCGCWSGAADHYACTSVGRYKERYGCRCGAPDDCYCHEDCTGDQGCAQHVAEWRESIVEDHAEAILLDIQRELWR